MNTFSVKKGFTLLELIISFGIMSIVIFGAASLYVSSIRGNASQIQRFIGYSLAQEGLEGVRNLRDSYFRQGLPLDGSGGAQLADATFHPGQFSIYRKIALGSSESGLNPEAAVFAASPWVFKACPKQDKDCDQLYQIDEAGVSYYIHKKDFMPQDAVLSPYRRRITLSFLKDDGAKSDVFTDRMLVTTHVEWSDHGTVKTLDLSTELTNWKQLPF